jgi:uncharacterized membrane protein (DUF106 family)
MSEELFVMQIKRQLNDVNQSLNEIQTEIKKLEENLMSKQRTDMSTTPTIAFLLVFCILAFVWITLYNEKRGD